VLFGSGVLRSAMRSPWHKIRYNLESRVSNYNMASSYTSAAAI